MSKQRYSFDHVLAVVVVEFLFDTRCRSQLVASGAGGRAESLDFVLFGVCCAICCTSG